MKKHLLTLLLLSALPFQALSQFNAGLEGGVNLSDYIFKYNGTRQKSEDAIGLRLGILAQLTVSEHLKMQSGVYYAGNGFRLNKNDDEYRTFIFRVVEIPLTAQFVTGRHGLFAGAGPYLAWNAAGHQNIHERPAPGAGIEDSRKNFKFGTGSSADFKALDIGLGVNAGVTISRGYFLRFRSQFGLFNQFNSHHIAGYTLRNTAYSLTIAHIFSPLKDAKQYKMQNRIH
jgi:hypothetical protein